MILGVVVLTSDGEVLYSRVFDSSVKIREIIRISKNYFRKDTRFRLVNSRQVLLLGRNVGDAIIIVIHNRKDPHVFRLACELVFAYMSMNVSVDKIRGNPDLRQALKSKLDLVTGRALMDFEWIATRGKDLVDLIDNKNCFELGLDLNLNPPFQYSLHLNKVGYEQELLYSKGAENLDKLVDLFLAGKFQEVLRETSAFLGADEYSRVLYIIASIMINNMDPKVTALPYTKMIFVSSTIEDPLLRNYLRFIIRGFIEYGVARDLIKFFTLNINEIRRILGEEDRKSKVYLLALSIFPDDRIFSLIWEKLSSRSPHIALLVLSNNIALSIMNGTISREKIKTLRGALENMFKKFRLEGSLNVYFKALDLLLMALSIILENPHDCESKLKVFYSKLDAFIKHSESKSYLLPNNFRGVLYLVVSFVLSLTIDKDSARKYRGYIQRWVRWVWYVGKNGRIFRDLYALLITNLISFYIRLMTILDKVACDVPFKLYSELTLFNQEIFEANKSTFSYFMYGLLSTLLWIAIGGISDDSRLKEFVKEILDNLDVLLEENASNGLLSIIIVGSMSLIKKFFQTTADKPLVFGLAQKFIERSCLLRSHREIS